MFGCIYTKAAFPHRFVYVEGLQLVGNRTYVDVSAGPSGKATL